MNHTLGKWEVIKERAPNGGTYYRIVEPNAQAHNVIAQVIGDGRIEYHANARLIAAAPELLEALELSKRNVESLLYKLPVNASEEKDILSAWMGRITTAITKAKGAS